MDIDFDCTMCGKCCHNLKIPLSVAEAINWLADGNEVQIITEAVPWPDEPDEGDMQVLHKRELSFPVMSGSLPTRVVVILAASFSGPCPNLRPDMRCDIYHRRPCVCRIYPAEANAFFDLIPANKLCPPEAWTSNRRPILRLGKIVDTDLQDLITRSHTADMSGVKAKEKLCAALQIDAAALVNEGFAVYSPGRDVLLAALRTAETEMEQPAAAIPWRYVSNRQPTIDVLASVGASSLFVREQHAMPFEYVGFYGAA